MCNDCYLTDWVLRTNRTQKEQAEHTVWILFDTGDMDYWEEAEAYCAHTDTMPLRCYKTGRQSQHALGRWGAGVIVLAFAAMLALIPTEQDLDQTADEEAARTSREVYLKGDSLTRALLFISRRAPPSALVSCPGVRGCRQRKAAALEPLHVAVVPAQRDGNRLREQRGRPALVLLHQGGGGDGGAYCNDIVEVALFLPLLVKDLAVRVFAATNQRNKGWWSALKDFIFTIFSLFLLWILVAILANILNQGVAA